MTVSIQTPEAVHSEKPETTSKEVAETTPKELSEHTYEFDIGMHCSGCSGAVTRVLGKLSGVKSYDVTLATESALVIAEPSLDYDTVYEKIKKTGKTVFWGQADGVRTVYQERPAKAGAAKIENEENEAPATIAA